MKKEDALIAWRWNDPKHFEAHRHEFARPVEEILREIEPRLLDLADETPRPLPDRAGPGTGERHWVHQDWELREPVGWTGLRRVEPSSTDSFWAYRTGRTVPSHLTLGERELTNSLCLWGWWESEPMPPAAISSATASRERPTFVIHTVYPGRVAPREIHDPEIDLEELPRAIEFWRLHAIVTERGAYTVEPNSP